MFSDTFSLLGTPMTIGTVIYTAVWQGLGNARLPFYATSIGMWCIHWDSLSDGDCSWLGACPFGPEPFWIIVSLVIYVTVISVI